DVRMRQAGHDREVVAELLDDVEVWRQLVVLARVLREEERRLQAERCVDAHHTARRFRALSGAQRSEGVEPGQRQRDAGGPQEMTTVQPHGNVLVVVRSSAFRRSEARDRLKAELRTLILIPGITVVQYRILSPRLQEPIATLMLQVPVDTRIRPLLPLG